MFMEVFLSKAESFKCNKLNSLKELEHHSSQNGWGNSI